MNIKNWKIRTRLGLAFGLLLLLLMATIWISIASLKLLNQSTITIVDDKYPKTELAYEILDLVNRDARVMSDMLLDDADAAQGPRRVGENRRAQAPLFDKLTALVKSDQGKMLLQEVLAAKATYESSQNKFLGLTVEGKHADAAAWLRGQLGADQRRYFAALHVLLDHQKGSLEENSRLAESTYHHTVNVLIALALLALAVGAVVAIWISRSITNPLWNAVGVARAVAAGQLGHATDAGSTDETGQLLMALKDMDVSLARIVDRVRNGADAVANASGEIAAGNADLATRTALQAGALEEAASTMTQLTDTVRQNFDYARQANQLTASASDSAAQGSAVVSSVIDTMNGIVAGARRVEDIVDVIDGIAFQTNILALNAAVEAARAGEEGRGFAVVAGEVRTLAQRSASAAKQIKELIADSVSQVDRGNELAGQTGDAMRDIVDSIQRVAGILGDIGRTAEAQTAGIEQVNQTVAQIDRATQQNAALVEQAAAASGALQDEAASLAQAVGVFTTEKNNIV